MQVELTHDQAITLQHMLIDMRAELRARGIPSRKAMLPLRRLCSDIIRQIDERI